VVLTIQGNLPQPRRGGWPDDSLIVLAEPPPTRGGPPDVQRGRRWRPSTLNRRGARNAHPGDVVEYLCRARRRYRRLRADTSPARLFPRQPAARSLVVPASRGPRAVPLSSKSCIGDHERWPLTLPAGPRVQPVCDPARPVPGPLVTHTGEMCMCPIAVTAADRATPERVLALTGTSPQNQAAATPPRTPTTLEEER